jgi:hypothetical protein
MGKPRFCQVIAGKRLIPDIAKVLARSTAKYKRQTRLDGQWKSPRKGR